jgi:hypothetical protein
LGIHKGEQLWKFSDFHMPVYFHSLKKRNGFDYFRFQVHSGVEDFPSKFGGVSGGGIWLPSMQEMKNGKIEYPPMLQGVIFYESRPYKNDTRRLLIGHGPDSIYNCVAQALR